MWETHKLTTKAGKGSPGQIHQCFFTTMEESNPVVYEIFGTVNISWVTGWEIHGTGPWKYEHKAFVSLCFFFFKYLHSVFFQDIVFYPICITSYLSKGGLGRHIQGHWFGFSSNLLRCSIVHEGKIGVYNFSLPFLSPPCPITVFDSLFGKDSWEKGLKGFAKP